jgi:hypothetical protein
MEDCYSVLNLVSEVSSCQSDEVGYCRRLYSRESRIFRRGLIAGNTFD